MKKIIVLLALCLPLTTYAGGIRPKGRKAELPKELLEMLERDAKLPYGQIVSNLTLETLQKGVGASLDSFVLDRMVKELGEFMKNEMAHPDPSIANVARASWMHDFANPYMDVTDFRGLAVWSIYGPFANQDYFLLAPGETASRDKAPLVITQRDFYLTQNILRDGKVETERFFLPKGSKVRLDETFKKQTFTPLKWGDFVRSELRRLSASPTQVATSREIPLRPFVGHKIALEGHDVITLIFSREAKEFFDAPILVKGVKDSIGFVLPIKYYPLTINGATYDQRAYVELFTRFDGTADYRVRGRIQESAFDEASIEKHLDDPKWFVTQEDYDGTILYRPTRRMLWRNDEGVSFVVEPSDAFVKSKEIPTTVQIDVIADIMSDEISPVSLVTPATTLEKFENNLFYGEKQRKYIDMGMLPVLEPKKYITPEMRADEELFLQARAQQMMHEPMRYDPTSRMPAPATAPKGIDPACLAKAQRFEYMYQISEGPRFIDLARVIKPFTLPNGQKVNVGDYVQLTGYNGLIIVFKESDVEKNLRDTAPQEKRGGTKPFIL